MSQFSVCLPNHLRDEFCQDNMCNASEPVLPKTAIKQQLDSDLEFFLVISPLLIWAGLPGLFMLWLLFKGLCCCTYKKITKICKKSKKINCSTELKWEDNVIYSLCIQTSFNFQKKTRTSVYFIKKVHLNELKLIILSANCKQLILPCSYL